MSLKREQQTRIEIYALVIVILLVGGFLFYLGWKDTKFGLVDTASEDVKIKTNYSNVELNPSIVTSSSKFKELKTVEVPVDFDPTGNNASSTISGEKMTRDKLSKIPRRNSDPFKPF